MNDEPFVPEGFAVPDALMAGEFRLPREMSPDDNLRDLERHAQDFAERRGFTYTVLSTSTGDVIGCVYIYPAGGYEPGGGAEGRRRASV